MSDCYRVIYDEQCEVCQAFASWLRVLDRRHQVDCIPVDETLLKKLHPSLEIEACLRQLHVVAPDGRIAVGWDAVAQLARLFPATWLVGALGAIVPFRWLGQLLYGWVASNRYALSKCRGGACRVARPAAVRQNASLGVFWTCYSIGMLVRLPLMLGATARNFGANLARFVRTWRRRVDLLDGKLSLMFLGGGFSGVVPLLFGENFWTVLYEGIAVDPGSPQMRGSLRRQLRRLPDGAVRAVLATHHHEEHTGNLNWLGKLAGAPIFVPAATADILKSGLRLPFARRMIIGAPPVLEPPFEILGQRLATAAGELEVFPAPGHCDDHVVLYDRKEKLLLAGDAFMGAYFSAPNPDVDSRTWLDTLERLLALDIEVLVEGHGLIHTLRKDIPDLPGVVVREHPRAALEKKRDYLRWLREQIESGLGEGLPVRAVEATCFPWGRRQAWESYLNDEMMRVLSAGHWSRTELVRSFVRPSDSRDVFPTVYQVRFFTEAEPSQKELRK